MSEKKFPFQFKDRSWEEIEIERLSKVHFNEDLITFHPGKEPRASALSEETFSEAMTYFYTLKEEGKVSG